MRSLVYILVVLAVLTSCGSTKYIRDVQEVEVPIVNTRVEYRDKLVYDSIYIKDSVFLQIKGDTVYKYVEKINTRYLFKTDTLTITDSIQVPVTIKETITETKEVNILHWWQKILLTIGAGFIIAVLIKLFLKSNKFFM